MTKSGEQVPSPAALRRADAQIRQVALGYPGASEAFPWGHSAFKVAGKTFLFLALEGPALSLSVKLPKTNRSALALPFASPTEYGLGRSGWVTGRFGPAADIPLDAIAEWIEESYRAIAPKRLLQELARGGADDSGVASDAVAARDASGKRTGSRTRTAATRRSTTPAKTPAKTPVKSTTRAKTPVKRKRS